MGTQSLSAHRSINLSRSRVHVNKAMSRSMPGTAQCTLHVVQVSLVFAQTDLGTDTDQQCHLGYAGTLPAEDS